MPDIKTDRSNYYTNWLTKIVTCSVRVCLSNRYHCDGNSFHGAPFFPSFMYWVGCCVPQKQIQRKVTMPIEISEVGTVYAHSPPGGYWNGTLPRGFAHPGLKKAPGFSWSQFLPKGLPTANATTVHFMATGALHRPFFSVTFELLNWLVTQHFITVAAIFPSHTDCDAVCLLFFLPDRGGLGVKCRQTAPKVRPSR